MKLPIGISDFKDLREDGCDLIDKSLLIKDVLDEGANIILFTRPRRFGKTLNMSMLYYYFASNAVDNQAYFHDLQIWQQGEKYQVLQGQSPVIFFTFKSVKFSHFADAYAQLEHVLSDLYLNFDYLLNSDVIKDQEKSTFQNIIAKKAAPDELRNSLKALTQHVNDYYGKTPYLLIDEYDAPIHSAYFHDYYAQMVDFMRVFLGDALKDNNNIAKGILTGILRIAKESVFSGLNNFDVYTVTDRKFSQYFGFNQTEVDSLLQKANLLHHSEAVKKWYNGYRFDNSDVYNPWSIMNCINRRGEFKPYWVNTSDNAIINKLVLSSDDFSKQRFEALLQGETFRQLLEDDIIFADLEQRDGALWNFLLHTGYLTLAKQEQEPSGLCYGEFAVPNREVALLYRTFLFRWFDPARVPASNKITEAIINGDMETFKTVLGKFLVESFSYFDTQGKNKEQIYHVFVLGLIAHLMEYYYIKSNRESGDGRYDVMMLPKDKNRKGIIFEFKVLLTGATMDELKAAAQQALQQIQDNRYVVEFQQHGINHVLQLGLAFAGKAIEIAVAV